MKIGLASFLIRDQIKCIKVVFGNKEHIQELETEA